MDFFGSKKRKDTARDGSDLFICFCRLAIPSRRPIYDTDRFYAYEHSDAGYDFSTREESAREEKLTGKLDSKNCDGRRAEGNGRHEPKASIDTGSKANIDIEPKSTIPALTAIPTPSVLFNEKSEANLPAAGFNGQLDLNTATLKQLDELPGIGESKAKAIIGLSVEKRAI